MTTGHLRQDSDVKDKFQNKQTEKNNLSKQKLCKDTRITFHPCQNKQWKIIIIILTEITTDITM